VWSPSRSPQSKTRGARSQWVYIYISGVAQWLACWAHNPKVRGSKPRFAMARPAAPRKHNWPRGVTVSTLDSESSDHGSNPREAFPDRDKYGRPHVPPIIFRREIANGNATAKCAPCNFGAVAPCVPNTKTRHGIRDTENAICSAVASSFPRTSRPAWAPPCITGNTLTPPQ
jgi:hypothetical protein